MGRTTLSVSEDGWTKPSVSGASIDRPSVLDALVCRYGVDMDNILHCERLITEVETLPVFLSHPVFAILARVDYG